MRHWLIGTTAAALLGWMSLAITSPAAAGTVGACACDCNENGRVTGTEVTRCVLILGGASLDECLAADSDFNGRVSGTDITRGVIALGAGANCIVFTNEPTATPTVTPTPGGETPTPTAGPALGERVFTIVKNDATMNSFFISSAIGIDVSGMDWQGTLRLVAGSPDGDGVAPLSLAEDAMFFFNIPLGGTALCGKILAAESTGFIDCDGGEPVDFEVVLDSKETDPADGPPDVVGPMGEPGPAGSAVLMAMFTSINFDSATSVDDCVDAPFGDPNPAAFTTGMVTGRVINASHPTLDEITLDAVGEPFSCETFTQTDAEGALVTAVVAEDAPIINQDVTNTLGFGDN